jgi:hypothetical protein
LCFADSPVVGKECLCPWLFFVDGRAVDKEVFTDGWSWPSVQVDVCRRRIPWPSAKSLAVGKVAVFGSGYQNDDSGGLCFSRPTMTGECSALSE